MAWLLLFHLLLTLLLVPNSLATEPQPLGCQTTCGDVNIPYPFGIGQRCALSKKFELNCTRNQNGTYNTFFSNVEVLNISLFPSQARIKNHISWQCYNITAKNVSYSDWYLNLTRRPFRFSNTKNKFTVIGARALAYFYLTNGNSIWNGTGCAAVCLSMQGLVNCSCSGIGCCQTDIPLGMNYYSVRFDGNFTNNFINSDFIKYFNISNFSNCSYAVLIEADSFNFSTAYITTNNFWYDNHGQVPVVVDWAIGNETCMVAQRNKTSYACISSNSRCVNSTNGPGYFCNCYKGYEGNPYLLGGCKDIDECAHQNPCSKPGKCHNFSGGYRCSCPVGWRSNHNSPTKCNLNVALVIGATIVLGFGTAFSIILLYFAIAKRIKLFEKRKHEKLKQKFFVQNRGLLLQQLIASYEDTTEKMRNFRLHELEKATNCFDNALIIGRDGHGEVYKGILSDQRVVAIKRSKIVDQTEIDQFINEVVILSQVNHRNVVKLHGCCLETEVPLLVYEFISNGTLFNHLHGEEYCSLTWKHRLRIALEAAAAISYLHTSASISVFHRDIKSSNILLDDYFTAKVSDFGASRSVQIDQTGITTAIQGTHGYLDPEYYCTGRLTQKSDVYSFGVILAELLTREKPLFSSRKFEGGSLIAYISSAMKQNHLFEILDPQIVNEGHRTELEAVAKLAEMCLRMKGEERPTMKEVEVRLEVLWGSNEQQKHPWKSQSLEERQLMLLDYTSGTDTTLQCSFEQELQSSSNFFSVNELLSL